MTTPATNDHLSGPRIFHPDTSPRQARLCQSPSSFSHSLGFKLDLSNLLVSGTLVGPIVKGPADCSIAKRSFLAGLEQVCPVHFALPPSLSGFRLLAFLKSQSLPALKQDSCNTWTGLDRPTLCFPNTGLVLIGLFLPYSTPHPVSWFGIWLPISGSPIP